MPIVIDPPVSPPLPTPTDDGSNLWELLYSELGFWAEQDEDNEFALRKFCEALCDPIQPVYDQVRERDDQPAPWSITLDPANCPVAGLPYLAQYVGAQPTPSMDEAQMRAEISEPTGWRRGQPGAIKLIAQRELTGTKWVRIRPRTPSAGHIYIRTLASETPNQARVKAELEARGVPAWEVLSYEAIAGISWEDVEASWESWEALEGELMGWEEVELLLADELP
jgi:hypothetical protein